MKPQLELIKIYGFGRTICGRRYAVNYMLGLLEVNLGNRLFYFRLSRKPFAVYESKHQN